MAARWRKQPSETGLRRIGQMPRGFQLREDDKTLLSVYPRMGERFKVLGWYWAGLGQNTSINKPLFPTALLAREDAAEFFKAWRKKQQRLELPNKEQA